MLVEVGLDPKDVAGKKFFRGAGCDTCNNTGYKGRVGLFELLIMTDDIRELIVQGASTDEVRALARSHGMVTLRDAGIALIHTGTTTLEEVVRETVLEA